MNRFQLRVRYADVDAMGWVYYGNYLRWFEIGRAEMLRALGRSYAAVEREDGLLLPVMDARCRYLRGARYDELLTIETGVLTLTRARVKFGYRILGEDGALCAFGMTEHCYANPEGRLVRLPGKLAPLLESAPRADADLVAMLHQGSGA